jgi:hypothetical protein
MMFSTITTCNMAYVILILIILSNILGLYLTFRYNFHMNNNIVLGISLIIAIAISIVLVWLANKTCNNYVWVSWVILAVVLFELINTIIILVDPVKREKELAEFRKIAQDINKMK